MDEDIYGTSVPHFQGETVRHNIQNVEPIIVPNVPKGIIYKYNKLTLCYNLMHTNVIGFLNNKYQHIMFTTGSMIKNRKKRTSKMELNRYTRYTYSVASK